MEGDELGWSLNRSKVSIEPIGLNFVQWKNFIQGGFTVCTFKRISIIYIYNRLYHTMFLITMLF